MKKLFRLGEEGIKEGSNVQLAMAGFTRNMMLSTRTSQVQSHPMSKSSATSKHSNFSMHGPSYKALSAATGPHN